LALQGRHENGIFSHCDKAMYFISISIFSVFWSVFGSPGSSVIPDFDLQLSDVRVIKVQSKSRRRFTFIIFKRNITHGR